MPYGEIPSLVFRAFLALLISGATVPACGAAAPATPKIESDVTRSEPRSPRFHRLRKALSDYRSIARRGGWPTLPKGALLRQGMRDGDIRLLRRRLTATGDLRARVDREPLFDRELELAVRRFQKRHGIADDGIVGPKTRRALNVPANRRIEQLRINLERARAMPQNLGSHYIFVNMADYVLKIVKDERTVLTMRIVVGTPHRQTPSFSAAMTYIDFNPFWNIPDRIAREEIVPRARQSPNYLINRGIRIFSGWGGQASEIAPDQIDWRAAGRKSFPYRLRQDPGPQNPLGQVKFVLPNSFEIYLHDTPAKQLFTPYVRTFSHGCIRVEKPVSLATHLLPGLSSREVRQIMKAGKRRIFHLAKPVAVHLAYLTAWVNKDSTVHFRKDVYRRDRL